MAKENNKTAFLIFRVTVEEKNKLSKQSIEQGFKNLSDFLRTLLRL